MHRPQLYLLTDESPLAVLLVKLDKLLATGTITLLQIRRKNTPPSRRYLECVQIMAVTNHHGVPVIINDDMDLAAALGVGVHLGQTDGSIKTARQKLGDACIGRTCHDSLDLVAESMAAGADYVAMGAMFASTTKPNARSVVLSDDDKMRLVRFVDDGLKLCVIGGIGLDNVYQLKQILPVVPHYIAITADIMQQPIHNLTYHCQKWQDRLQDF